MNKINLKYINLSLIILSMIVGTVGTTYAATITVDDSGGADYTTIGAAVSVANTGDTILVNSGIYTEQININKQLTLQGIASDSTKPVINSGTWSGIYIYNINGVIIEGFNITGSNNIGIYISQANDNKIRNNDIRQIGYGYIWGGSGINAWNSNNNEIANNVIEYINGTAIGLGNSIGNNIKDNIIRNNRNAISTWSGSNSNIVSNNIIESNSGPGINLGNQVPINGNNIVNGNTIINNNGIGISIGNATNNNIFDNILENNNCGVTACHSSGNTITNNIADRNTIGISLWDSSDNTIRNNTVNLNDKPEVPRPDRGPGGYLGGIYLWKSDNNILIENKASDNPNYGIYVNASKNNDIFNNLFNNTVNYLLYNAINNRWNTIETVGANIVGGPKIAGNYWAKPSPSNDGFSQTCNNRGDGICDTSYNLDSQNIDNLPLTLNGIPVDVQPITVSNNVIPVSGSITATAIVTGPIVTGTAAWNWDDGTPVNLPIEILPVGTVFSGSYIYNTPGVYSISLTVTDGRTTDTEYYQYVAVYNPDEGFVTGGGWINSPPGAYIAYSSLTGKANFGFVSKYKKDSNIPIGNTEFQFKVANLNFHSDEYQWLVVAGPKAQYKGDGVVNGENGYGFLLTATDGQINGGGGVDKFRIKIWNKTTGSIIYDNALGSSDDIDSANPQAIDGGSIVIHKK